MVYKNYFFLINIAANITATDTITAALKYPNQLEPFSHPTRNRLD